MRLCDDSTAIGLRCRRRANHKRQLRMSAHAASGRPRVLSRGFGHAPIAHLAMGACGPVIHAPMPSSCSDQPKLQTAPAEETTDFPPSDQSVCTSPGPFARPYDPLQGHRCCAPSLERTSMNKRSNKLLSRGVSHSVIGVHDTRSKKQAKEGKRSNRRVTAVHLATREHVLPRVRRVSRCWAHKATSLKFVPQERLSIQKLHHLFG